MNKNKKIIISIALISLFALYGVGRYLITPHQTNIGDIPQNIKKARAVSFPSKSGAQISGWLFSQTEGKGGVLLLHGVKSNRLQMLSRAIFLQKAGYKVLLIDFQAHGESIGKNITFGGLEALDVDASYKYLADRVCNPTIAIIGVSLGGASALLSSAKSRAKVMILESVYPTIEEAIKDRLEIYLGSFGRYLSPLLTLQLKPSLGFGIDDLRPIDAVSKVEGAVVIIAGSKDKHTTIEESKRLFNRASKPKELWIVDGKHQDFHKLLGKEYENKILDYLSRWM